MNYKDSGGDIQAGRDFVERVMNKAPAIGGFGGMFRVPSGYDKPTLVSGADGVGTKINIARVAGDYTTIGIDLVAMCVNDVITCGALPLYFLDYIYTQKLDENVDQIMEGIIKGCEIAGVELIGGETAEHSRQREYDLAGFCTGIVEETEIIDGRLIKAGDKIVGLPSSGLHSNGYTLINDMLWRHKITFRDGYIGKGMPELLTPTTIYAPIVKELMEEIPILGMAHITRGGIPENLPRCIPEGLTAVVDYDSWDRPEVFKKIAEAGDISEEEMRNVFNLGIGYCLVVPSDITIDNIECFTIGEVVIQ